MGQVDKLRLLSDGRDCCVEEMVVSQKHAFTLALGLPGSAGPVHPVYLCVSVCVSVVFVQRWFENLQFSGRMLLVKVGKGCCFFQGHLVLKSLQIQICFYEVAVGPFVAFICKAGAVTDKIARCDSGFQQTNSFQNYKIHLIRRFELLILGWLFFLITKPPSKLKFFPKKWCAVEVCPLPSNIVRKLWEGSHLPQVGWRPALAGEWVIPFSRANVSSLHRPKYWSRTVLAGFLFVWFQSPF